MKKMIGISMVCVFTLLLACAVDYGRDIVGTWDAGKAAPEKRIVVTIGADGSIEAAITNSDMRPVRGTYTIKKNRLFIKLPNMALPYDIMKLEGDKLVLASEDRRITWTRIRR
jgi:hypothetical protein